MTHNTERIIVSPKERRLAVLQVIDSARRRLILSPGECDDRRVLEAIQAACRRGVHVEALLNRRSKGRSTPRLLRLFLEAVGVQVWRYQGPHGKYHAKYAVADDGSALVGSLNFTRRCFRKTCDFLLVTHDRGVASGLTSLFEFDCRAPSAESLPRLSPRLVVGPDHARHHIGRLLEQARRRICLIDPKLSDPGMLAVLDAKATSGIAVTVRRHVSANGLAPHGKLLLVDDGVAMVGSMALSVSNLDVRREVGVTVSDRRIVQQLVQLFDEARSESPSVVRALRPAVA